MSESVEYINELSEAQLGREERRHNANTLLRVIASCGRKFFRHKDNWAYFIFNNQYRIFFVDNYTQQHIYTHRQGYWKGFSHGGTLKALVEKLRDYIKDGTKLPEGQLGPWPDWYCKGDLWGYGEDMEQVREAARKMEITQ